MSLLNAALCVALATGDYYETQHAIYVLNENARTTDAGKETAAEVAAKVIAEHYEKAQADLAAERARLKLLREALVRSFQNAGRMIEGLSLSESAKYGVQAMSRDIATTLDATAIDAAMKEGA